MKKRRFSRRTAHFFAGFFIGCTLLSCSPNNQITQQDNPVDTGLKNMGNGICLQQPSGLMWQIERGKKISTFQEASDAAAHLELGGFSDWRLPTKEECYALAELLTLKKGDCPIKNQGGYWIKSTNGTPGHWEDYPLCGGPEFRWVKDAKGYVRAVRP